MRILVLGGTVFLSRTIAELARDAGHQVTCVNRGLSGNPPEGVELRTADRDDPHGLLPFADADFDAVVDVERQSPTRVRRALEALAARAGHWTYVSSGSVYSDATTTGQDAASSPLESPPPEGADEEDRDLYGRFKVACEEEVRKAVGDKAFICRAGLIVGPRDTSDRFGYWPARMARGGEVLVPGDSPDLVQFIDVRDLAAWIVHCAQNQIVGTFDGIAPARPWGQVIEGLRASVGAPDVSLTWVPTEWLAQQ
ncbi:MAG: NAD-dependent epimerase/dehydratase family protein, partial [Actinomycetota bacterium]|nr:NAD-dependent epimerase/dehydratase family protein [Actinomycetota bacterium]